jgi:tetratricopeptide (TPR) repeat protein
MSDSTALRSRPDWRHAYHRMSDTICTLAGFSALLLVGCASNPSAHIAAGDYEDAEAELLSSLTACGTNQQCAQLGSCQLALGELREAENSFRRSMALARQMGLVQEQASAANGLASTLLEQHRDREAQDVASTAERLALPGQLFTVRIEAASVEALAMARQGNPDGGLLAVSEAEKIRPQIADPQLRNNMGLRLLSTQAAILRLAGDCERSEKAFQEVLDITYGEHGDRTSFEAHLGLARCARRRGKQDEEHVQLGLAKSLVQQKEQRLKGKTLDAWRRQTLPLIAAEKEAEGLPATLATADLGFAYALLYCADGDVKGEVRAAARVPTASPDYAEARILIAPLIERIRVVQGRALWLRKGPDATSGLAKQLPAGTWIEIMKPIPGWARVRTEFGTGWLEDSPRTKGTLRRLTDLDLKP